MAADRVRIAQRVVREHLSVLAAARAELAIVVAVLCGWALVTLAIARVIRPDVVWPLSAGLFLLALCGVQWLGTIIWAGLYQLTRKSDG
jgi:hypothetical protein